MKQFFKSHDVFGHPMNLGIGNEGHEFKTFVGGFISFFIKTFMFLIVSGMSVNMFTYQRNITNSKPSMLSDTEMNEISNYSQMSMELYFVVQGNNTYNPLTLEEMKKYIHVRAG